MSKSRHRTSKTHFMGYERTVLGRWLRMRKAPTDSVLAGH